MGLRLAGLAFLGALVLAGMVLCSWRTLLTTSRTQKIWCRHSERIFVDGINVPVYRLDNGMSLLAVTGIFRPRIFISKDITLILSTEELRAALAHEIAHVSAFDNLKRLLLKITRSPRWINTSNNVDAEWGRASEIAADQHALATGSSVLDLSSALIKVGRLNRPFASTEGLASHLVQPACNSALEVRIMRLSKMLEGREAPVLTVKHRNLVLPVMLTVMAYLACVNAMLPAVYEILEFLVR
ncbi:MAG: M56 family metallopeptidase [Candidatus Angelobacter sp.]